MQHASPRAGKMSARRSRFVIIWCHMVAPKPTHSADGFADSATYLTYMERTTYVASKEYHFISVLSQRKPVQPLGVNVFSSWMTHSVYYCFLLADSKKDIYKVKIICIYMSCWQAISAKYNLYLYKYKLYNV